MSNSKNIKLLYCLLGSFILVLLQSPLFFSATYAISGGGSGSNELIYKLFSILSFIGVILMVVFSIILIAININFTKK